MYLSSFKAEAYLTLVYPQHGFARNVDWSIVSSENVEGNPTITLELKDGPYSRSMWDYSFQALYKVSKFADFYTNFVIHVPVNYLCSFVFILSVIFQVTLDRNTLSTELKVTNTDGKPFSFTTALHTYFRVSIILYYHYFGDSFVQVSGISE